MTLQRTLFIAFKDAEKPRFPLEPLMEKYSILRDAVAGTHRKNPNSDSWELIASLSFIYAFNVYKAIGLILAEQYYEAGSTLLRQLWEVSLNLHWIACDPATRTQEFGGFTLMETRRILQKTEDESTIAKFDIATDRFQSKFHKKDAKGRMKKLSNFSAETIKDRARNLGEPWKSDYDYIYELASMHAHGKPGAVLHQYFVSLSACAEMKERDSTGLIAFLAMRILVDDLRLLVKHGIADNSDDVDAIFADALKLCQKTWEGQVNT